MRLPWRRETKSADVLPEWLWEQWQSTGVPVAMTMEHAVGLPAVLAVIRLLAHAAGMVPLHVLRDVDGDPDLRERARDTWQWRLLHRRPGPPPMTRFAFKADLAASFAGRGNAYVRKLKPTRVTPGRPRVIEVLPLNAAKVKPVRTSTGTIAFDDATADQRVRRGTDEIIQARSFTVGGVGSDDLEGVSPITRARRLISGGLSRQEFEDQFLREGIFPGVGLQFPEGVDEPTGKRWIERIEARHQGAPRAGRVIGVGGGAQLVSIPISLQDAQFAEQTQMTIVQAGALWQIPKGVLEGKPTRDEWRWFVTFALGPILEAIAQAFNADPDLFDADQDGEDLLCEPLMDALNRPDTKERYDAYRLARQGGWIKANELRRMENMPPADGGDEIQHTPVGGAPNAPPAGDPNSDPEEDEEDEDDA